MRRALGIVLGLAAATCSCAPDRIDVHDQVDDGADYGRGDLLAAVEAFATGTRDAASFRVLALALHALEPQYDAVVAAEAERQLVLMALGPLETSFELPLEQRFAALGVTVWPTALGVEPKPGETPAAYAERICANELALSCNRTVDRWRPLVLDGIVWGRLEARAHTAVTQCRQCAGEPGYAELLAKYDDYHSRMSARLGSQSNLANPGRWPIAGERAEPLTAVAVFSVDPDGNATYDEQKVGPGEWGDALEQRRGDASVLSVHLEPRAQVRVLRQIAADAAAAGFDTVALQVRAKDYPFPLAEYRLATSKRAKPVRVRDVETIQVLVQALDVRTEPGRL